MSAEYRPWFQRFPDRFTAEKEALEAASFILEANLFEAGQVVAFEGRVSADPDRQVSIVFPDAFPSMPPRVFDRPPSALLRRHHQPTTREFCLFGIANERWNAENTSLNVLEEVSNLLSSADLQNDQSSPDLVPEPITEVLKYDAPGSILVPPPISGFEPSDGQNLKGEVSVRYCQRNHTIDSGRGVVVRLKIGSELFEAPQQYHTLPNQGAKTVSATVLVAASSSKEELRVIVQKAAASDVYGVKRKGRLFAVIFREQSGTINDSRWAWVFARVEPDGKFFWIRTFPYRSEERMARIPNLRGIEDKSVIVVGCGCLGSKIALNLAASGLGNITLIDHEYAEPYNSVRQEAGFDSFGLPKTAALSWRLFQANPEINTHTISLMIGGINDVAAEKQTFEAFAKASLIVDTTGSHGVSRWINDIASELARPVIYVSVTNGVWSGEIVRCVPGRSACWRCWNDQFYEDRPPGESTAGFFAPGCNQPSFTGTTYDAQIVASLGCSMIVDTLLGTDQFEGDYLLWKGRDLTGPILKTDVIKTGKRVGCPFCGNV